MSESNNAYTGIIILGMHRGGTSLLAHLVQLWGAYADEESLIPGDAFNPQGYWEPAPLVALNDELLAEFKSQWSVPPGEDSGQALAAMARRGNFRTRALDLLATARAGQRPWFWKDPRLSILLPFWKELWGDVLYLVPVREPGDIADSLLNRDGMSPTASLLLWQKYMSAILADEVVRSAGGFFSYERTLANPKAECERLSRLLDQRFGVHRPVPDNRVELMAETIDASLWRSRGRGASLWDPRASDVQRKLRDVLLRRASFEHVPAPEDFPMQPRWREIVAHEIARRYPDTATAEFRIYWRGAHSEYSETRVASMRVAMDGTLQSPQVEIPRFHSGGSISLRIDLADRPAVVSLTALEVRDSQRNVVWVWDGRASSIAGFSKNEVASCTPLHGEAGCILQLQGFDPWLEIPLDAELGSATVDGAFVFVQCKYSSPFDYSLFTRTGEALARLQQLETAQANIQQEIMSRLRQLEAASAAMPREVMSRLQELEAAQAAVHREDVSRLQELEAAQVGDRAYFVSHLQRVETEQTTTRETAMSRLQQLETEHAGLRRTIQELLDTRLSRFLLTLGGARLRQKTLNLDSTRGSLDGRLHDKDQ